MNSKEENSSDFVLFMSKNSASGTDIIHHLEMIHLLIEVYQGDLPPYFAPSYAHFKMSLTIVSDRWLNTKHTGSEYKTRLEILLVVVSNSKKTDLYMTDKKAELMKEYIGQWISIYYLITLSMLQYTEAILLILEFFGDQALF